MRILVVEDERLLVAALKRGLEAEGYAVDEVVKDRPQHTIGEVLVIFLDFLARQVKRHNPELAKLTIKRGAMRP